MKKQGKKKDNFLAEVLRGVKGGKTKLSFYNKNSVTSNFPSYLHLTMKCFEVAESCTAIQSAEYQQYFQTCGNVFPHT